MINIPKKGIIKPVLGTQTMNVADALFPKVRQRVLAVLFGTPDRSFFANEVIALARSGTGAVQRELADLTSAGLLTVRPVGNQKHYQANAASPVFAELRALVLKTVGLADVVRRALDSLAGQIDLAFIHGSVARQQDTAGSDVDLIVVSPSLGYGELMGALDAASQAIARPIHPVVYTPGEWQQRLTQDHAFVTRVMQQPRIWLYGGEAPAHERAPAEPERTRQATQERGPGRSRTGRADANRTRKAG